MKHKIGQQLIIGLQGKSLSSEEANFIVQNNIAGVVLFDRNVESPQQLHGLTTELQNLRQRMADKAPLFICIDMEGGRVARLKAPFTQWPPAAQVGKVNSTSAAFKMAQCMGAELSAVGINVNFAPCVDILTNSNNPAIGDRSLGNEEELVSRLASALVRGFIKANIIPCAKHFPGHGDTLVDSHEEMPKSNLTLAQLQERELLPFKKAFRARLDMVMTSHLMFEKIDSWPVTLSEKFLTDLVRKEFRYRNLIITDDLDMKGLTKHYSVDQIAVRALQAGANILLYCNVPSSPVTALEAISKAVESKKLATAVVEQNHRQILEMKKEKIKQVGPLMLDEAIRIIGHPDHLRLSQALVQGHVPEELTNT